MKVKKEQNKKKILPTFVPFCPKMTITKESGGKKQQHGSGSHNPKKLLAYFEKQEGRKFYVE